MRFTIVTPVFNGMPWLPATMESVGRQRVEVEVEHLVVDGGSTDGSREWLAANAASSADLLFEPDHGQTEALVRGFARATGDVLGWLNADDLLEPGALGLVAHVFAEHPDAVAVSGAALTIGPDGEVLGAIAPPLDGTFVALLEYPTNLAQPSTFFRREAYVRAGGLNVEFDMAMDVDLWLRLAQIGPIQTRPDDVLSRFRVRPGAKSVIGARTAAREDLRIRRRHGLRLGSPASRALIDAVYLAPVRARLKRAGRRLGIGAIGPDR